MKAILVATDFSERSAPALRRGLALAKAQGAVLHILHIIGDDLSEGAAEALAGVATEACARLVEAAKEVGVSAETALKRGEAHKAILETASETKAEIILIGAHKRDAVRNAYVGTTAERMLLNGSTPILIVRSAEGDAYRSAALAANLAEEGAEPIRRFQALGLCAGDAVTPVYAYDSGEFQLLKRGGASLADLQAAFEAESAAIAPTVAAMMREAGLQENQALVRPNFYNTPDTIFKAAAEAKADLLVVGARRKTAFKRYTLGSVSEACILGAQTDLLVLPPED